MWGFKNQHFLDRNLKGLDKGQWINVQYYIPNYDKQNKFYSNEWEKMFIILWGSVQFTVYCPLPSGFNCTFSLLLLRYLFIKLSLFHNSLYQNKKRINSKCLCVCVYVGVCMCVCVSGGHLILRRHPTLLGAQLLYNFHIPNSKK